MKTTIKITGFLLLPTAITLLTYAFINITKL
jgi:hypothetical protein